MRGIPVSIFLPILIFFFLVELISYLGMSFLLKTANRRLKITFSILYWLVSFFVIGILFYAYSNPEKLRNSNNYQFFYFTGSILVLNLIPKIILSIGTLLSLLIRVFARRRGQQIFLFGILFVTLGAILIIGYGIIFGKSTQRTVNQHVQVSDLPRELSGFRIVQISDLHLGSFCNDTSILKDAVETINRLNADVIVFTGDIVNNFSYELIGFEPILNSLKCRYGKFAILGNHDYGDYSNWPDSISKAENLEAIKAGIRNSGFDLLLNESRKIEIDDTAIYIIGVENWGHPPFPQYAKLENAIADVPENSFKILLSHDPSHWQAKVTGQTNIQLTLSGHTHGGQFGIRIAGIEFSPIYLIGEHWGGLYQSKSQYLYVNRGFGCIGFNGRIDMKPEISSLTITN